MTYETLNDLIEQCALCGVQLSGSVTLLNGT